MTDLVPIKRALISLSDKSGLEALAAGTAVCPVCTGALRARHGAARMPVAGRCGDCGSALA